MSIELFIVVVLILIASIIAGLFGKIRSLERDLEGEKTYADVYKQDNTFLEYQLSEMEAGFRDAQHILIKTTMGAEEMQHQYDKFVDIVVNEELNRLDKLYYSERLDQVIEFRELTQIGEL